MTKEFRYFSYLKLDSSVVTLCTKTDGKWKVAIFWADMAGIINLLLYHRCNDTTKHLKTVPSKVTVMIYQGTIFRHCIISLRISKLRIIFLHEEKKNYDFIQQFVSFTSPPSHRSAILESICWTQTVYAVLFQPHHTDMLFSFKSKLK